MKVIIHQANLKWYTTPNNKLAIVSANLGLQYSEFRTSFLSKQHQAPFHVKEVHEIVIILAKSHEHPSPSRVGVILCSLPHLTYSRFYLFVPTCGGGVPFGSCQEPWKWRGPPSGPQLSGAITASQHQQKVKVANNE
eukprot:scaffold1900_cov123-Cylindrotheca_fusiformis.AAC.6